MAVLNAFKEVPYLFLVLWSALRFPSGVEMAKEKWWLSNSGTSTQLSTLALPIEDKCIVKAPPVCVWHYLSQAVLHQDSF